MNLGKCFVGLVVEDIQQSMDFYSKLGFERIEGFGGIVDKWVKIKNGTVEIGLFEDMFPQNILLFSPSDTRQLYNQIKAKGVEIALESKIDLPEGPCRFAVIDPDGNVLLFDH